MNVMTNKQNSRNYHDIRLLALEKRFSSAIHNDTVLGWTLNQYVCVANFYYR